MKYHIAELLPNNCQIIILKGSFKELPLTDFQPFVTWRHLYYQWSIFTILIFKHPSCEALRLSICVALKNSSISQKASFINRLWRGFYLLKLNKQARYGYKKLCTLTISKTQIKSKFRIHHSSNRNWKLHSAITYNYYRWIDVLDTLIEPIFFGGIYTYNAYMHLPMFLI